MEFRMNTGVSRRGVLIGTTAAAALLLPADGAAASAAASAAQAEVSRRLRELERSYAGRIGAFACDSGNGATLGHRAHERFPLLSTFKMLAAAAVLRTARRCEPGLLDRLIRWTRDDVLPNSPVTGQHVDTGLTVAQLCDAAITRSDNTAGNLLLSQIGGPAGLTAFARTLGDPTSRLDRWETDLNDWRPDDPRDTTTPAAIGRDLARLTIGSALVPQDRQLLNGWLRGNTTGGARIRAGLPTTWVIAVAWPPGSAPLIIAIYTNRHQPDAAADNQIVATTATVLAGALGKL
jgi:beta-lactamase class A